ncbi:FxSxx-COOH cyclophane-containing RiPP peptide [Streptomyces longwoodensis]|uniref:FxSxx-COOH cyclophane-containing RiPP peptide n=1 Tax=Streptomyces longwoodensis TaxID=68231 RepID=UPI00340C9005
MSREPEERVEPEESWQQARPSEPEPAAREPLPDVLELDLEGLRTVRHPVLREVLEDLRARAARPSEMLWGFNNSF